MKIIRELVDGITFRQFAAMAELMHWTVEELVTEFRGIAGGETTSSFCSRVLRGDPDWNVVIPYRRMILKYVRAVHHLIADGKIRACACGCGSPVVGRDRLAWPDCKFKPTHGQNRRGVGVPMP
jgi:hypothetical protein